MSKKSEAEKLRQAFESAIRSLMYAPKIYGSPPEKRANTEIEFLDFAIRQSQDVDLIKKLLEWKAKVVTEEESEKAKERERWRIKLHPDEMDVIVNIALDLLSGHDPRQLLGIKPKRGPRVDKDLDQWEMEVAICFWSLRMNSAPVRKRAEPMRAKPAANEVAKISGASPQRVEKIGRKRKQWATAAIDANPDADLLGMSKWCLAYCAGTLRWEDGRWIV
jgi:hypothetical protein